jgi:hypothetical protein
MVRYDILMDNQNNIDMTSYTLVHKYLCFG